MAPLGTSRYLAHTAADGKIFHLRHLHSAFPTMRDPDQPKPNSKMDQPMTTPDYDNIDLRILRLLVILQDTRSLARTAAALGLSVSQASRLLAQARATFGNELFTRHGPEMIPTPDLTAILPRLHDLFRSLSALFSNESEPNLLESSETIRIGAVDNTALVFVAPFIKAMHERAPKLHVEVVPLNHQALPDLRSGTLDLVVACDPHLHLDDDMRSRLLICARMKVLARRGHPMSGRGAALTTAELDRYPMISPTISQPSGVTAPILTLNQLSSQRVLQMPYFLACAWTLLDTDAYMVVPAPLTDLLAERLPVEAFEPADLFTPLWIPSFIWHARTDLDPLRQWVRAFLITSIREKWRAYLKADEGAAVQEAQRSETREMRACV